MNHSASSGFHAVTYSLLLSAALLMGIMVSPAHAAGGLYSSLTPLTEPTPAAGDNFGAAFYHSGPVLSADGQTALVAALNASVGTATNAGKVYIFHFANGKWALAAEFGDPDATRGDQFGSATALNANGTVALIGSFATVNGNANAGKAYLYTLSNGTWTKAHEFDDPADATNDFFGATSTALAANGQSAVIGAWGTTVNNHARAGEAYIYTESNGTWTQTAAIPDPDDIGDDSFAFAAAMSGDGQSVLIGSHAAVNGQSNAGKAYFYTLSNGTWVKAKEFDDPLADAGDRFGGSGASLSQDGQTAAISACGTTVNGNAGAGGVGYIFNDMNGVWAQTASIPDPDNTVKDCFSSPAAVSANGSIVLFGSHAAVNGNAGAGKAYLYTLSNGTWVKSKEFDDPAATAGDFFGGSGVALSGDGETALMGAATTTVNGLANAGEAYIYQSPDDLSLAISASPGSVTTGQQSTLEFTVTNTDSAVTANNLSLTDTLPSGLGYASANAGSGSCSTSGSAVTCTLASLAPGATWQPSIIVSTSGTGTFTNSANVTSNEPDPNMANNQASATVTANAAPSPAPSAPPPPPKSSGGGGGTFDLLVLALLGAAFGFMRTRRRNSGPDHD